MGCILPSGRKKRIMVACVTFETSKVVEPALYYEINKAHIIHYVKDPDSESGKIYGSVTTIQIAEALAAAGVELDKKDITILSDSVKETGVYEASVKCYKDIKGTFKFEVVAEE